MQNFFIVLVALVVLFVYRKKIISFFISKNKNETHSNVHVQSPFEGKIFTLIKIKKILGIKMRKTYENKNFCKINLLILCWRSFISN